MIFVMHNAIIGAWNAMDLCLKIVQIAIQPNFEFWMVPQANVTVMMAMLILEKIIGKSCVILVSILFLVVILAHQLPSVWHAYQDLLSIMMDNVLALLAI